MRNSLLLITLGTALIFDTFNPLRAQAPPAATKPNLTNEPAASGVLAAPVVFEWKSGPLLVFVGQIKEVFGIDLNQRADIPGEMHYRRVPSMKIKTTEVWQVLNLYNSISMDYPELGRWAIKWWPSRGSPDSDDTPSAILLIPSKPTNTEESSSIRAFTVRDIPGPEQEQLFKLIDAETDRLQKIEAERGGKSSLLRGDVHFHKETGICVATGGKTYVEMVGSLIDAFRGGRSLKGPYHIKPPDDKFKPPDDK
jgi:hypothetical protein